MSSTFYWVNIDAGITAFYWTEVDTGIESNEGASWCNPIDVTPKSSSFLGVAEAPENLLVIPEDVELEPEEVQADDEDWTILPDPE